MTYRVLPLFLVAVALVVFGAAPILGADAEKGNTHEGKVVSVTGNKLVMTDRGGKNQHTHTLAADARVTCDGKACKLSDLKTGMFVRVTTKKGDKTVAVRIEARKGTGKDTKDTSKDKK